MNMNTIADDGDQAQSARQVKGPRSDPKNRFQLKASSCPTTEARDDILGDGGKLGERSRNELDADPRMAFGNFAPTMISVKCRQETNVDKQDISSQKPSEGSLSDLSEEETETKNFSARGLTQSPVPTDELLLNEKQRESEDRSKRGDVDDVDNHHDTTKPQAKGQQKDSSYKPTVKSAAVGDVPKERNLVGRFDTAALGLQKIVDVLSQEEDFFVPPSARSDRAEDTRKSHHFESTLSQRTMPASLAPLQTGGIVDSKTNLPCLKSNHYRVCKHDEQPTRQSYAQGRKRSLPFELRSLDTGYHRRTHGVLFGPVSYQLGRALAEGWLNMLVESHGWLNRRTWKQYYARVSVATLKVMPGALELPLLMMYEDTTSAAPMVAFTLDATDLMLVDTQVWGADYTSSFELSRFDPPTGERAKRTFAVEKLDARDVWVDELMKARPKSKTGPDSSGDVSFLLQSVDPMDHNHASGILYRGIDYNVLQTQAEGRIYSLSLDPVSSWCFSDEWKQIYIRLSLALVDGSDVETPVLLEYASESENEPNAAIVLANANVKILDDDADSSWDFHLFSVTEKGADGHDSARVFATELPQARDFWVQEIAKALAFESAGDSHHTDEVSPLVSERKRLCRQSIFSRNPNEAQQRAYPANQFAFTDVEVSDEEERCDEGKTGQASTHVPKSENNHKSGQAIASVPFVSRPHPLEATENKHSLISTYDTSEDSLSQCPSDERFGVGQGRTSSKAEVQEMGKSGVGDCSEAQVHSQDSVLHDAIDKKERIVPGQRCTGSPKSEKEGVVEDSQKVLDAEASSEAGSKREGHGVQDESTTSTKSELSLLSVPPSANASRSRLPTSPESQTPNMESMKGMESRLIKNESLKRDINEVERLDESVHSIFPQKESNKVKVPKSNTTTDCEVMTLEKSDSLNQVDAEDTHPHRVPSSLLPFHEETAGRDSSIMNNASASIASSDCEKGNSSEMEKDELVNNPCSLDSAMLLLSNTVYPGKDRSPMEANDAQSETKHSHPLLDYTCGSFKSPKSCSDCFWRDDEQPLTQAEDASVDDYPIPADFFLPPTPISSGNKEISNKSLHPTSFTEDQSLEPFQDPFHQNKPAHMFDLVSEPIIEKSNEAKNGSGAETGSPSQISGQNSNESSIGVQAVPRKLEGKKPQIECTDRGARVPRNDHSFGPFHHKDILCDEVERDAVETKFTYTQRGETCLERQEGVTDESEEGFQSVESQASRNTLKNPCSQESENDTYQELVEFLSIGTRVAAYIEETREHGNNVHSQGRQNRLNMGARREAVDKLEMPPHEIAGPQAQTLFISGAFLPKVSEGTDTKLTGRKSDNGRVARELHLGDLNDLAVSGIAKKVGKQNEEEAERPLCEFDGQHAHTQINASGASFPAAVENMTRVTDATCRDFQVGNDLEEENYGSPCENDWPKPHAQPPSEASFPSGSENTVTHITSVTGDDSQGKTKGLHFDELAAVPDSIADAEAQKETEEAIEASPFESAGEDPPTHHMSEYSIPAASEIDAAKFSGTTSNDLQWITETSIGATKEADDGSERPSSEKRDPSHDVNVSKASVNNDATNTARTGTVSEVATGVPLEDFIEIEALSDDADSIERTRSNEHWSHRFIWTTAGEGEISVELSMSFTNMEELSESAPKNNVEDDRSDKSHENGDGRCSFLQGILGLFFLFNVTQTTRTTECNGRVGLSTSERFENEKADASSLPTSKENSDTDGHVVILPVDNDDSANDDRSSNASVSPMRSSSNECISSLHSHGSSACNLSPDIIECKAHQMKETTEFLNEEGKIDDTRVRDDNANQNDKEVDTVEESFVTACELKPSSNGVAEKGKGSQLSVESSNSSSSASLADSLEEDLTDASAADEHLDEALLEVQVKDSLLHSEIEELLAESEEDVASFVDAISEANSGTFLVPIGASTATFSDDQLTGSEADWIGADSLDENLKPSEVFFTIVDEMKYIGCCPMKRREDTLLRSARKNFINPDRSYETSLASYITP